MSLKLSKRDIAAVAARGSVLLARMEAGLYYQWDLGYNTELKEDDLQRALRESRKNATRQKARGN